MDIEMKELEILLDKVAEKAFNTAYKNNPDSTVLTNTPQLQGQLQGNPNLGGAFSAPGVRPQRYSAMPRVRTLSKVLQPTPSDIYNEIIGIVTGATASIGTNPTDYCGIAPTPGALKTCRQSFSFGKWFMKTNLNSVNDIGSLRNRADIPGMILNGAPEDNPLIPDIMWRVTDTRSQAQYMLYLMGVAMERALEPVLILGDSTKTHANTTLGWISEFKGLDGQIATGKSDTSGVLCPAADSMVITFNAPMTSTAAGGDGRTITQCISDLYYAGQDRAAQVGLDSGLEYAFLMRKEQFRALTDVYAITYATARFPSANMAAGTPALQDAIYTNNFRESMLQGQYLTVEGVNVPVIFSDGIPLEGLSATTYNADIYLVPISWAGGRLLRLEYFNLANQWIDQWNGQINPAKRVIINNGFYAMGYHSSGFCDEWLFASSMRLILEAPFLAGRIDNVSFTYQAPTRNAIPSQSLYVNGGLSYYTPPASTNV